MTDSCGITMACCIRACLIRRYGTYAESRLRGLQNAALAWIEQREQPDERYARLLRGRVLSPLCERISFGVLYAALGAFARHTASPRLVLVAA